MFFFQPSFQPFDYGAVPPTPIYNIQQGANGELYAEPDPSMSFHPSQVRVTKVDMNIKVHVILCREGTTWIWDTQLTTLLLWIRMRMTLQTRYAFVVAMYSLTSLDYC